MKSKKKSSHHKKRYDTKYYEKVDIDVYKKENLRNLDFEEFIGNTVTIFVNCGGAAGSGFTGVIIGKEPTYIRLLILPATPPSCSLTNDCLARNNNTILCSSCPHNNNASVGVVAEILISSIVAFVHNK
ncbi:hypothetical protein EHE19_005125 [Ruminiclostridium herbifermentans]|uniref:Uncharacterized protein n=1 Tax=Ruminiclostridium herbifermentans TaxID=2488810 RepID=A0A4U7JD32_9FIRM|nr:hypothetical protein [Ruminiclostridium herbifermentans]QNU67837.1 hypothetical protein EHE19_005125 [Ruminiclostridium herbifermentans]